MEERQAAPGKKRRVGPKKTRGPEPVARRTELEDNTSTGGTNQDVTKDANILWLSDSKFNLNRIKEAQKKDPIVSYFKRQKTCLIRMMSLPKAMN